jgi:hypothetical protein
MKIFYNLTGSERKSLVAAISQKLNTPAEYLGAPTFAYQVGDYHIDKNGMITGEDSLDLEDALFQKGFRAEEREYDEPDTYESGLGGLGAMPSIEEMQTDTLTIEMPLEGFTKEDLANLEKLIASKAGLIKKALGVAALPIEQTETTLRFPWFAFGTPGEDVTAYTRFVGALYSAAKKQQRVTAKEHAVDNEKFAFRVFLIRLGFVGDDYKAARKILLRNLFGNSAFKVAPRTEEVDDHE